MNDDLGINPTDLDIDTCGDRWVSEQCRRFVRDGIEGYPADTGDEYVEDS